MKATEARNLVLAWMSVIASACATADHVERGARRDAGGANVRDGARLADGATPSNGDGGEIGDGGCGATEICDDGLDNNCNGQVDEQCPCNAGTHQRCYGGPPANAGVGACSWGMQTCTGEEIGAWGACTGWVAPRPDVCGETVDNDCDGNMGDDSVCHSCQMSPSGPTGTHWEQAGPMPVECVYREPRDATVPDMSSGVWMPHASPTIDFSHGSQGMCPPYQPGTHASGYCACDNFNQLTFFRTRLDVTGDPSGHTFRVTLGTVDDRAAVRIINDRFPLGQVLADAVIGTGLSVSTGDLSSALVPGTNWIVVVHADTCCWWSALQNVNIQIDGHKVAPCS